MARLSLSLAIALALLAVGTASGADTKGWLQIHNAGDFSFNSMGGFSSPGGEPITSVSDPTQALVDDFFVPEGKTLSQLYVGLEITRGFNRMNPQNPLYITFLIWENDPDRNNVPNIFKDPVISTQLVSPIGNWTNMTNFADGRYYKSGYIMREWFLVDTSAVNNNAGLSSGHYWFGIFGKMPTVPSSGICNRNTTYALTCNTLYATIGRARIGKGLLLPHINYDNSSYYKIDILHTPTIRDRIYWEPHVCIDCDLSVDMFGWTDVAKSANNFPPPLCYQINPGQSWDKFLCPSKDFAIVGAVPVTPSPSDIKPSPTPSKGSFTPSPDSSTNITHVPSQGACMSNTFLSFVGLFFLLFVSW